MENLFGPHCSSLGACLLAIPNVVWSGIVASLITVLGVMVTNFGLSKRHREQLEHNAKENARKLAHDASESALDRKMSLRREVYVPAAEAVITAMSAVASMMDPIVSRTDINKTYLDALATIGKVSAVAGTHTVAAVGSLVNCMGDMNIELSLIRNGIDQIHGNVVAFSLIVDKSVEDHGRWIETQTSMLFDGPPDAAKWRFVQGQINFKANQIREWTQKRDAATREIEALQLSFLRTLATWQPRFTEATISASIALRTELELQDDNVEAIKQTMIQNAQVAQAGLLETISRLEQAYNLPGHDNFVPR
jgi:hypothetical protein